MATLWENIHSHAVCTRLNFSTTCQCTRFNFKVKPCTFNLPLQQKTKKMRRNDCNKRGKSCKRGNTQLLELFITMYTPNDSCSGVYLSQTHASITASQAYTMIGVHYMDASHVYVIGNHLRVIWNVHMLFFQGIHGNGKSQQRASLCCTRSTSKQIPVSYDP